MPYEWEGVWIMDMLEHTVDSNAPDSHGMICRICDAEFNSERGWKFHMKKEHPRCDTWNTAHPKPTVHVLTVRKDGLWVILGCLRKPERCIWGFDSLTGSYGSYYPTEEGL
jgi:hypothetical protein